MNAAQSLFSSVVLMIGVAGQVLVPAEDETSYLQQQVASFSEAQRYHHTELADCGAAPALGSQKVDELISSTKGLLEVAIKNMRCTLAIEAALEAKGITATTKYFESPTGAPGAPLESFGASDLWKWLHCKHPDDANMHSYIFVDGAFIGNGFQAADKVNAGQYDSALGGTEKSCKERFPDEAKVVDSYKDDTANKVLLFGWQGCPCTGIAEARFAAASLCYQGRTWADPSSKLMSYLQCETKDTNHHSFVYFKDDKDEWEFVGTGFDVADNAMTKEVLDSKVQISKAEITCKQASVAVNVYGGPLEECRLPGEGGGGSWNYDGKCSETTGGIHQICIQAGTLPHDFSMNTYQNSDWSESRTNNSHCICVGAWSTYMTEETKHAEQNEKITPRCKSIPETVLTKGYMGNWKSWNGFVANVGMGLGELVKRCLKIEKPELKCGLKTRFMKLNEEEPEIKKSTELDAVREELGKVSCDEDS